MKTHLVCTLFAAALFVAGKPQALDAQAASTRFPTRWSIEIGLGGSHDRGGNPRAVKENFGVADVGATFGIREWSSGTLLAGVNFSGYLNNGSDLVCPIDPAGGGCIPDHPEFSSSSLLAGWQTPRPERGSLRVVAGPGVYRAANRGLGNTLGWQARADLATPSFARVSLVGSVRATVVPNAEGTRYRQRVLGLGIRIH